MNDLLSKVKKDLTLRGYSDNTIRAYLPYIEKFANYYGKSPEELGSVEILNYLYDLTSRKDISYSYIKTAHSALKFVYKFSLNREWDALEFPRSKAPKTLPVILSKADVQKIINASPNLKYKAIFSTIYRSGLRIGEAQRLKIKHIDSSNMQIFIKCGKGKKDRYTILSQNNLLLLRDYWLAYHPRDWLFPGRNPVKPISTRFIQRVFTETCQRAGIRKDATPHTLRHCFATHMLEAGTDLYYIQKLLGHARPETTTIYLHLKKHDILAVKSPLD